MPVNAKPFASINGSKILTPSSKSRYLRFPQSITTFRARHNHNHDPGLNYLIWHTEWQGSIFYHRTVRRIQERRRDGLWWTVSASLNVSKNATVRKWAIRRLQNAWIGVLESKGFDREGRVVKNVNGTPQPATGLRGSLKMELTPSALAAEKDVLRREAAMLLNKMEAMA